MSKDNEQPKSEAPQKEHQKQSYFFPNVADGPAFSIEAASYEEAVEANKQHLKDAKKGTT